MRTKTLENRLARMAEMIAGKNVKSACMFIFYQTPITLQMKKKLKKVSNL